MVEVYLGDRDHHVGWLRVGGGVTEFQYESAWLRDGAELEPGLPLQAGPFVSATLPLSFQDAAPDDWGRRMIARAARVSASDPAAHRAPGELEILLASGDDTRQGALRFSTTMTDEFEAPAAVAPEVLHVGRLLADADAAASDDWQAIKRLLEAGSGSLGGARPKAAVRDGDDLWLAKFPRSTDSNDVPLWEMVGLDVAARAGVATPERRLLDVGGRNVLLVRRFDRDAADRVPYISARTMVGARDLGRRSDYLELATELRARSSYPLDDLEELWLQAAVSVLLNDNDNHLRNIGFVARDGGWSTSPVFDLDPNHETGVEFQTPVMGASYRDGMVDGLMRLAEACGFSSTWSRRRLDETYQAFEQWPRDATRYGATEHDVDRFSQTLPLIESAIVRALR